MPGVWRQKQRGERETRKLLWMKTFCGPNRWKISPLFSHFLFFHLISASTRCISIGIICHYGSFRALAEQLFDGSFCSSMIGLVGEITALKRRWLVGLCDSNEQRWGRWEDFWYLTARIPQPWRAKCLRMNRIDCPTSVSVHNWAIRLQMENSARRRETWYFPSAPSTHD